MQLTARWVLLSAVALIAGVGTAHAQTTTYQHAPEAAPQPLVPPAASSAPPSSRSPLDVGASLDVGGYADSDHVFVLTPVVTGRISNPTAGWSVDGSYLVDVVSAASVDIVSTASGPFTEIRQAGTLNASYQPHDLGASVNTSVSREPDYLSVRAGGSVTDDLLDKNLTLFLGYEYGHDIAGRTATPFSVFSNVLDTEALKAGATFVLDRRTIASVVGDAMFESGDQSKPYRYIPLFAPGTDVPIGAPVALVTSLRLSERPLEELPLSRDRFALSFRLAHRFGIKATLRADERIYDDTWALGATTTDARLLFDVGPSFEVGPHVRFHAQSPVSFWQRAYTLGPGNEYPALRTGDRELGPLLGTTLGWSTRLKLGPADHRTAWVLGWDLNVTETHYLDDIYIVDRLSAVTSLSVEAEL
jgi:hypothetical protein